MRFSPKLQSATLIKRYKRFLADVMLDDGKVITIHCPNTGSMKNCDQIGATIWYSTSSSKTRKYPHTWEITSPSPRHKIGINTNRANGLVLEAIESGLVSELQGYKTIRTEVPYGEERSRIDILLESDAKKCFVEVKNVTLFTGKGIGMFPDAVSIRATKHLRELVAMAQQGYRAVLFFCVQHTAIKKVCAAEEIDPNYGKALRESLEHGVEVLVYGAKISCHEIKLTKKLEFFDARLSSSE